MSGRATTSSPPPRTPLRGRRDSERGAVAAIALAVAAIALAAPAHGEEGPLWPVEESGPHGRAPSPETRPHPPQLAALLGLQPAVPTGTAELWRPTTSGPFITLTAPILAPGDLTIQPLYFERRVRGSFDADGRFQGRGTGEHASVTALELFVQLGVLDNIDVAGQLNFFYDRREIGDESASSRELGDTQFLVRYALVHETAIAPEVTFFVLGNAPTGKFEHANRQALGTDIVGSGAWEVGVGLNLTKAIRPLVLHADLLHSWALPAEVDGVRVHRGDVLAANAALEWPLFGDRFALLAEVNFAHREHERRDGAVAPRSGTAEAQFAAGLEIMLPANVQVLLGYQRVFWGKNVDATDALAATALWTF